MKSDAERAKLPRFEKQILVYPNDLERAALRLTGRGSDAEDSSRSRSASTGTRQS